MWCGQSFKSLADMTQHMKVTQHYTNIISQEQITSWKTPEEKAAAATAGSANSSVRSSTPNSGTVNQVMTCKVCNEGFTSLKDLSAHMIKNQHFKDGSNAPSERSTPTSVSQMSPLAVSGTSGKKNCSNNSASSSNCGNNSGGGGGGDRRKKSLPVRKLLQLERGESKRGDGVEDDDEEEGELKSQLLECDDCHEKIESRCFLQHIKQCRLRSNANKSDAESERSKTESITDEPSNQNCGDSADQKSEKSESVNDSSSSGSLSALEKLIEKNFDSKSRRTQQTGILQRLGIDEEVFPPWQNMAPSPFGAMSPTSLAAAWPQFNGLAPPSSAGIDFTRTNSRMMSAAAAAMGAMPQLRYRRNSSSKNKATESNGSFSSQETEEEESCDESANGEPMMKRFKGKFNFPIANMLNSPNPIRPTSASSNASSISPSPAPGASASDANRMTPASHRSADDEDETDSKSEKTNGLDESRSKGGNPWFALQKLLDKTENQKPKMSSSQHRASPFGGWNESAVSPASASPPAHSPASVKSDAEMNNNYGMSKCAFCDTQVTSRAAYRAHLVKIHLQMQADLLNLSAISDEELLLLVLAKNSNLPLLPGASNPGGFLAAAATAAAAAAALNANRHQNPVAQMPKPQSNTKKDSQKRKSSKSTEWEKSSNPANASPASSPAHESSHSKFLKYAQLAKQLSSKYV